MNIPRNILIEETSFHNAWARAVRAVLRDGVDMVIGDMSDPKPIRDICTTIVLTGDAIRQIEDREVHVKYPFSGKKIDVYCEEYHRDAVTVWQNADPETRFVYIYADRFINPIDQIGRLRVLLSIQVSNHIASNRDQAITWQVENDGISASPPCLQRIWIRYLGDQSVEVHMAWRSRDLYGAWQANMIALVDFLNREVIHPSGCRIVKIVDFNDSLHIYKHSIEQAKEVKLVQTNPQDM